MIDLEQEVEVRWNNFTKNHFKNKGYVFTKPGDAFIAKAKDLAPNSLVLVECDECHKKRKMRLVNYNTVARKHDGKYYCKSCTTKKRDAVRFSELIPEYYNTYIEYCKQNNYTPLTSICDIKSARTNLYCECKIHGKFSKIIESIRADTKCPKCADIQVGIKNSLTQEDLRNKFLSVGVNVLNIEDYKGCSVDNLIVECSKCHKQFITNYNNAIKIKHGMCRKCVEGISRFNEDDLKDRLGLEIYNRIINPYEYINSRTVNLQFKCIDCDTIYLTSFNNLKNGFFRCRKCTKSTSIAEKTIEAFLLKYNIEYSAEYRFDGCKDINCLPFDFYLPRLNMCIEFDGEQHYRPIYGEKNFDTVLFHDKIKDDYCKDNGINLVRIPYYKRNDLESILTDLLF